MSWLSKKFEELTAQVNPFDNGRTAATVRAARTQPQPAQTSRSNISVGVARPQGTVRVAAPTPTPAIRVGNRRITQSPTMTNAPGQGIAPPQTIQNIGKGLVKSVTEPYTTLSTGIAETLAYNTPTQQRLRQAQNNLQNLNAQNIAKASQVLRDPNVDMATKERYAKLANSQANMASQTFDQANQRNQEIQSRTDPVKGAASVGSIGLDIATLGVGTGSTSALKTAGLQGAKQFGKRLAIESAKTGLVGAAGGALSPYVTNGRNATIGDVAKGAAYGAAVGAAVPGISYGASTLKAPTTRLVSGVKTNMAPLNEGGFIELGRTPKNIHQEDQNIMSDFIDYVRGAYKPDQKMALQLELDASRIAERYGLKMPPTLTGLADVFDKRLRKEFKPSIWKDEAGSVGKNIRDEVPDQLPGTAKGVILNESKPLSDGSKVVTKARKGANGLETYQERVDKFTDKPVSKAKQREMISQIKPTALDVLESKDLDKLTKPEFRDLTNKYLGSEKSGEIKATQVARDYNTRHGKLTAKQKNEVIFGKDDPTFKVKDASVNKAIKELQKTYDDAYNYFTKQKGLKFGYQHDYYPREYVNVKTGAEVTAAEYKLLQTGSSRMKGRTSNELAEWKLKFRDPAEALQSYHQNLERAAAGQKYIADLEQNGFVMKSTEPVKGMRPIVAEGMQSDGYIYYAKPKVADKLNKIFGSQEASGFFEKAVEKARDFNSFTQSFVLSGGVPNTPINAFGIMQLMKNGMALHPVQGGKAFLLGMSRKSSTKFFDNHANYLKMMAEEGIDVRYDYSLKPNSGIYRVKKAAEEKGNLAAIGQAWDEITNDATFGRFMPALEVLHFKGVHDGLIRKGVDPAKARQTAAKATANFYGKNTMAKEASRSKVATDAAGAALFAPRFRESMVNFWGKNVSALKPGNITKKEYRDNLKFLASAGAVFATMDAVNKELNGTHMWDNPDGKKDKLLIPNGPDGKYIGVPFLPSISTVPRNVAMGAYNLATGKPEEAGKNISSFFSIPLKTATEVGTNENYFGQRIVDEDSSTAERLGQMGSHIAKNNLQPWIREGMNIAGQGLPEGVKKSLGVKEKSGFETVSNALEAPLRFYDPKYFKKAPQNFANGAYSAGEKANPSDAYDTVSKAFTLRKGQLPNLDKYDSEAVKNAAKQVNKDFQAELKSYGLPTNNLKFDTVLAKDYADFKKNIKGKNEIEVAKQTASFLKTTYKGQYLDDTTKSFYNLGDNDMRNYITSGKLTKKQMDKVIELDDLLTKSGLQKYPQVGKILRSELGYGLIQTSRSGGRSTGRSTRSGGRKTSSRKKYGLFGFSDGLPMASTNKSLRSLLEKAIVS